MDNARSMSGTPVNLPLMTRAFASAASDFLLEHGPLSLAELHALAVEEGLSRAKSPSSPSASLSSSQYVVRPADRLQLPAPRYDRYVPYERQYDDDVVQLDRWGR